MTRIDGWVYGASLFCLGTLVGSLALHCQVYQLTLTADAQRIAVWQEVSRVHRRLDAIDPNLHLLLGHVGALDDMLRPGWHLDYDPDQATWGWVVNRSSPTYHQP